MALKNNSGCSELPPYDLPCCEPARLEIFEAVEDLVYNMKAGLVTCQGQTVRSLTHLGALYYEYLNKKGE